MSKINSALTLVSAIQIVGMEMYHYLFRGGATIGNLFIDDIMVWGNALVRAYDLENSLALYPRIIVDIPLLDMLTMDQDITTGDYSKYAITLDTDNMYYLDYLKSYCQLTITAKYRMKLIEESYIYYMERLPSEADYVRQKLSWQVSYLKRYIESNNEELVINAADEG